MQAPGMQAQADADWLSAIRVILIRPTETGNIGAAARAMKTMGLSDFILVDPKEFPSAKATARASGADDLLASVQVVDDLPAALAGCDLVMGTSARLRDLPWPLLNPREAAEKAWQHREVASKIALVFGSERSGMTNEEMDQCHFQIHIPANDAYSSLNLAASVQVLAYEFRMMALIASGGSTTEQARETLADREQMEQFYAHLFAVMEQVGYYRPQQPRLLRRRLMRLFNRPIMTRPEVQIMRGFLSMIQKTIQSGK